MSAKARASQHLLLLGVLGSGQSVIQVDIHPACEGCPFLSAEYLPYAPGGVGSGTEFPCLHRVQGRELVGGGEGDKEEPRVPPTVIGAGT